MSKSKIIANLQKQVEELKKNQKSASKSKDTGSKGKGKKKEKDLTKPKQASSTYIHFSNEYIPMLKKDPAYEGRKHTEFMGLAGKKWAEMDEAAKAPYEKMNLKDKERFARELAEWKEYGYYTNEAGVKSTELAKKSRAVIKDLEDASDGEQGEPAKKEPKKMVLSAKRVQA